MPVGANLAIDANGHPVAYPGTALTAAASGTVAGTIAGATNSTAPTAVNAIDFVGSFSQTVTATGVSTCTVNFATAYPAVPRYVGITAFNGASPLTATPQSITATGFTINYPSLGAGGTITTNFLVIP